MGKRTSTSALALLLAGGCDRVCTDAMDTQRVQVGFVDPFSAAMPRPFASGDAVVAGSSFCPEVAQWYEGDDRTCVPLDVEREQYFGPCWDEELEGPATQLEGGCLRFDEPGIVRWNLTPAECDVGVETPQFEEDQIVFDVLAVEDVSAKMLWWFEEHAVATESPGPEPGFPSDWIGEPDAEVRLVANGPFVPLLGLFEPDSGAPVGFTHGVVQAELIEGQPSVGALDNLAEVTLDVDDRVRLDLALDEGVVPGPSLVGVPISEVASLELVASYQPGSDGEPWGPPTGVRAVVRDAQGGLLRVPAVDWAAVGDVDPLTWHDVVLLSTGCSEPQAGSGSAAASVTATVAGITETIELAWTTPVCEEPPPDPFDPDYDDPWDLWSCSCQADASHRGGPIALVGFGMLLALRRRRRATAIARVSARRSLGPSQLVAWRRARASQPISERRPPR